MNDRYTIERDSDTGPGDEGYWQWWTVLDNGEEICKCNTEADAIRIMAALTTTIDTAWATVNALGGYLNPKGGEYERGYAAAIDHALRELEAIGAMDPLQRQQEASCTTHAGTEKPG